MHAINWKLYCVEHQQKNSYAMNTTNLLFEYQCTSGIFIRLPNRIEKTDSLARIESKLFCRNWNAVAVASCRQRWTISAMNSLVLYFASAVVSIDSSHLTTSSSALWSRFSPPSNFVDGHVSTMWFIVCHWPQSQEADWVRPICAS